MQAEWRERINADKSTKADTQGPFFVSFFSRRLMVFQRYLINKRASVWISIEKEQIKDYLDAVNILRSVTVP